MISRTHSFWTGLFVGAWLLAASSGAQAEDWPQWRGPGRDGISKETGLMKVWPQDGPPVLWKRPLGQGFSTFSVVGDRAFTMYQDGAGQYAVCLDAKTGREVWKVRTGSANKYGGYPGPRSTPTVDGERVYFLDGSGNLFCLEVASGKEVWSGNALSAFQAKNLQWAVSMSPLVMGDVLIVNVGESSGSSVVALNKMSGKYRWKSLSDKAGYSSPILRDINGSPQLVLFLGTGAAGLSPDDGKLLWRFPWKTSYDVHAATPIVDRNRVFITSGYGVGAAMFEIQPGNNPRQVWRSKEMKSHFGTPVLVGGHLYGFDMSVFRCLNFETGQSTWKEGGLGKGSLMVADGMAYVLGGNARMLLGRLTPSRFEKVSEFRAPLSGRCWTMPVVSNGRLFLRNEQDMVCYDVKAR